MRVPGRLAAIPLFILTSPLAASQQDVGGTIIIKGTPLNPEQARQRAVDFVKSTGVANGQQQVARWVVPICIKVIGLSKPHSAKVVEQMLSIAREASLPIARPSCEPNVTVNFVADAGEVVRHIYARKPARFSEASPAEREQLLYGSAPVRWWYATEMMDRDGVWANSMTAPWMTSASPQPFALPEGMPTTQQYNSGSHVRTPTVRSLYGATIIVDVTKATGTRLKAISDFAAMVAFAEMDADAPPPDSILGLFQPSSAESMLTDWDLAFLKSLYRMPLDRRARIQRGHLVEALIDERAPAQKR